MGTEVKNLIQALCEFHLKVEQIHKLSKAQYGMYADLQTILQAVTPALCECGLAITQTFEGESLVTILHHTSGEEVRSQVPLLLGDGRNALHVWGGAVTYQRRYSILAILNLAAGIEDDDGQSGAVAKMQKVSPAFDDELF
jgi:hypothetical protein